MEEVRGREPKPRGIRFSYIERLPDGYNTMLSDDGVNISKGQQPAHHHCPRHAADNLDADS